MLDLGTVCLLNVAEIAVNMHALGNPQASNRYVLVEERAFGIVRTLYYVPYGFHG